MDDTNEILFLVKKINALETIIEARENKIEEQQNEIERWKKINQDLVSTYGNRNERLRDALRNIKRELERYCSEGWTTKAIEIAEKALEGE